jgi:hypothetical protein
MGARIASVVGAVAAATLMACSSGPQQDLPASTRKDVIASLCSTIAREDADNGGVRADGKSWELSDLVTDASLQYAAIHGMGANLMKGRSMMHQALASEPQDITIAQLCDREGALSRSRNASLRETVASATELAAAN